MLVADRLMEFAAEQGIHLDRDDAIRVLNENRNSIERACTVILRDMNIILSPGTPPLASHNNCQNNRRIFPDDEDDEDDKDRSSKRFRLGTALTEDAAAGTY